MCIGAEPQRASVSFQPGNLTKRKADAKASRFEAACLGLKVNLMVQGAVRVGRGKTVKEAGPVP